MTPPSKSTSDLPQQDVQSVPSTVELRPCPFCGKQPTKYTFLPDLWGKVSCNTEECPAFNNPCTLKKWNQQQAADALDSLQAQLAEVQKQLAAKDAEIEQLVKEVNLLKEVSRDRGTEIERLDRSAPPKD